MSYWPPIPKIATILNEVLRKIVVLISEPFGFPGVLEVGEEAKLWVVVHNNTGYPLRDVVVTVFANRSVTYDQDPTWDPSKSWSELEPGRRRQFYVKFTPNEAGTIVFRANVEAEIVPYASCIRGYRQSVVY